MKDVGRKTREREEVEEERCGGSCVGRTLAIGEMERGAELCLACEELSEWAEWGVMVWGRG